MRKRFKKVMKNKDGSAIVFAIAILVVLVVFALALLLVSYSLFSTAAREQSSLQTREYAQTLSAGLQYELEIEPTVDDFGTAGFVAEYPLWNEIYNTIHNEKWIDYSPSEYGHSKERAFHYYKLSLDGLQNGMTPEYAKETTDNAELILYWQKPEYSDDDAGAETDMEGAVLVVMVSCGQMDKKTTVTSYYSLKTRIATNEEGEQIELWKWELSKRE